MEVVYRMFDLTLRDASEVVKCWTPGRAPGSSVLNSYMRAKAPTSMATESVAMQFTGGQLFATVTIRGWWPAEPPLGWANGASRVVLLRQASGGTWTVDAVIEEQPQSN